ncbi:unnamed protein product [Clavelina lepadiformis]|uniref:Uncharacterized protein n=1 Tax=Clavelina lepadiformis TaxID=159417 RepID=A0ABP0GR67_CLALP
MAEEIYRKINNSNSISGTEKWWIGLDDRRAESLFEWSSGEPYDSQAGHYSNWAGSFMGFNENLDCAVINDLNALLWEEVDCNDEYGFICLKTSCNFPLNYSVVHRDECYHFRLDPNKNDPSIYKKTLEDAKANCEKASGFWVPLYDQPLPSRLNATDRNWFWKENGVTTPLGTEFNRFVADEFFIVNVGRNTSLKSKLPYEERCLFGDPVNHVYSEPFGPFEAHHYARSKSCRWNHKHELTWVWASTYHLKSVQTGLCLTAPFEQVQENDPIALSPGVRVRPCNLSDEFQQWVCHSRNPFHLKLRNYKYSMLLDKVEPWDRAYMAGSLHGEECKTLWRSPDNEYICDERYRPSENLLLVRSNGIKPPPVASTPCTYPSLSLTRTFVNQSFAKRECYLYGGRPAMVNDIRIAITGGFSEGCACAYVSEDAILRGVIENSDVVCQGGPGMPSPVQGLFLCTENQAEYVWCFRGTVSSESNFFGVQYAPFCATYSFLKADLIGFEERSCLAPHYFACKRTTPDCCSAPNFPDNSFVKREDWRVGGDGLLFWCIRGYGINGSPTPSEARANCTESGGVRSWDPDISGMLCQRLPCSDPSAIGNSTMTTTPPGITTGNFKFGDNITYECDLGYEINGQPQRTLLHSSCGADQQWQPDPANFECLEIECRTPPRVANARAIYNASEESLWYNCNLGYWIRRGQHNVTGFVCNITGYWVPDPLITVSCTSKQ